MVKLTKKLKEIVKFIEDNPELRITWSIKPEIVSFIVEQNIDPKGCTCHQCNYCWHGPKVIVKEFKLTDAEHLKMVDYNQETRFFW